MTSNTRTRVMLVGDHSIMRYPLRDALGNTGRFEVVAQAANGEEAHFVTDLESTHLPHKFARLLARRCWNH